MLKKYKDVFSNELSQELPLRREMNHKIKVVSESKLLSKALYQLNKKELLKLKKQLNDLQSKSYNKPNRSLYGAILLFVDKNDGKLCMCIDYKALNKGAIKNNYLLS